MARPAQHLAQVVEQTGTGNATAKVVNLIERGLKAANDASQEERAATRVDETPHPYVTDAGKCPRKVQLRLRGVEETEPLTTDSLVNFGGGHAYEEWLASILEPMGAVVEREFRVEIPTKHTVVSGRIDFLVTLPDMEAIVELKTTSSRAMGFMLRRQQPGRDEHRKQLNLYLHAAQLGLLAHKYEHGFLVYLVKDPVKGEPVIHAFQVDYDARMAEDDLAELDTIATMKADMPMPWGYEAKKYPCLYCSYKSYCWSKK